MPFRDKGWEQLQRDCAFFPAYVDFLYDEPDTQPDNHTENLENELQTPIHDTNNTPLRLWSTNSDNDTGDMVPCVDLRSPAHCAGVRLIPPQSVVPINTPNEPGHMLLRGPQYFTPPTSRFRQSIQTQATPDPYLSPTTRLQKSTLKQYSFNRHSGSYDSGSPQQRPLQNPQNTEMNTTPLQLDILKEESPMTKLLGSIKESELFYNHHLGKFEGILCHPRMRRPELKKICRGMIRRVKQDRQRSREWFEASFHELQREAENPLAQALAQPYTHDNEDGSLEEDTEN